MIEPEYYSLEQAAEILPYSSDDLLHMGANGKLDVAVLVGGHAITKMTVIDSTGSEVAVSFGAYPGTVVKVERKCIQSHEAGLPARVTLAIYYGQDGGNSEVLTIVDPMEEDGDLLKAVDFMMKDAKLVIWAADLKRLQEPEPQIDQPETDLNNTAHGETDIKQRVDGVPEDETKGRRLKQLEMILGLIKKENVNPLDIPEGIKNKVKVECLKDAKLFTESSFPRAWTFGNSCGRIRVRDKEKYLKNQN